MNPLTHFFAGWVLACPADLSRRDRALICAASVAPDLDGLGLLFDIAAGHPEGGYVWYGRFHHVLGHNILFILAATLAVGLLARRRAMTALLAFTVLQLHILADVVGARGPDGFQWPIAYLLPFTDAVSLSWRGQWMLNAWPNVVITAALVALTLFAAWRRGYSPVGLFSERADRAFVETLRRRFGRPPGKKKAPGR
ncbi:MAG: metal-dependent hydrolase [Deltaproteobacteria bacterium]|nr:metal-dependent hydrolase [Candidatus Zymogenaceae bacterium]